MKVCTVCQLSKDESEFYKNSSCKDGCQNKCILCQKEYFQNYYKKNTLAVKTRTGIRRDSNKNFLREFIISYLNEHPCVDCGEKDIIVLDFDHLFDKKYNISDMIRGNMPIERLKSEMEKCAIRCANCHRRKTAKDYNWHRLNL